MARFNSVRNRALLCESMDVSKEKRLYDRGRDCFYYCIGYRLLYSGILIGFIAFCTFNVHIYEVALACIYRRYLQSLLDIDVHKE